jgi:hypothetical protein
MCSADLNQPVFDETMEHEDLEVAIVVHDYFLRG